MAKRIESPSSINTFKQCQRKYYHQYIEKLPTFPSIHTVRGNIAHSCLEHFYDIDSSFFTEDNCRQKCGEAIQKLLIHYWRAHKTQLETLKLNPDQIRFYFEETLLILMNWTNQFIEKLEHTAKKKNISLHEAFQYLTPLREKNIGLTTIPCRASLMPSTILKMKCTSLITRPIPAWK